MSETRGIIPIYDKNHPDTFLFAILQQMNRDDMIRLSNGKGVESMINQVTLVGRLTRDPELKKTTEGISVTHITLAVNRSFRNQNGEMEADFVPCTLWRRAAENTSQYCRKGTVVGITGRLQSRHYDNKEGKRVYVTEVVAETIRFLSAKPQSVVPEQKKEETTVGIS
ncbi:single-strand DNA-binding protein [Neobacillus cucumis]|nr:single-strand DNA-binding protein [Neobacillus cucumis]